MKEFENTIRTALEKRGFETNKKITNDTKTILLVNKPMAQTLSHIVDLDMCFVEYNSGSSIKDIVNKIIFEYNRLIFICTDNTFDNLKERICFKLINKDKNQKKLEDMPYISFYDLAIVFYIIPEETGAISDTYEVDNYLLKLCGNPDIEYLLELARENTKRLLKGNVLHIDSIVMTMLAEDTVKVKGKMINDIAFDVNLTSGINVFVAMNERKQYGASMILYDGFINDFGTVIDGKDFYIIPSSVHELLLMPVSDDCDIDNLLGIVSLVNRKELAPADYLSDNVYLCRKKENGKYIIEVIENRKDER